MEGLKETNSTKEIPHRISDSEVLSYISNQKVGRNHILKLIELSGFPEATIASWFEISVETFRSYQEENADIREDFKEKLIVIKLKLRIFPGTGNSEINILGYRQ